MKPSAAFGRNQNQYRRVFRRFGVPLWPFETRGTTKDAKDTKMTDAKKQEFNTENLPGAVGWQDPMPLTGMAVTWQ